MTPTRRAGSGSTSGRSLDWSSLPRGTSTATSAAAASAMAAAIIPGEFLAGLGMGVALPPLFDFILAGVTLDQVGSASGVLNAIQQFGGALGIAVFATILFSYVDDHTGAAAAMTNTPCSV